MTVPMHRRPSFAMARCPSLAITRVWMDKQERNLGVWKPLPIFLRRRQDPGSLRKVAAQLLPLSFLASAPRKVSLHIHFQIYEEPSCFHSCHMIDPRAPLAICSLAHRNLSLTCPPSYLPASPPSCWLSINLRHGPCQYTASRNA